MHNDIRVIKEDRTLMEKVESVSTIQEMSSTQITETKLRLTAQETQVYTLIDIVIRQDKKIQQLSNKIIDLEK